LDAAWGFAMMKPSFVCKFDMFDINSGVLIYLREQMAQNSVLLFTKNNTFECSEKETIYAVELVLSFDENTIYCNFYETTLEKLKQKMLTFITSPEGSITLVDGKLTLPSTNIISSRCNLTLTKKKQNTFGIVFPELAPLCVALDDDPSAWSKLNPGCVFWNPYHNASIKTIHDNVYLFCAYLRETAALYPTPLIVQLDLDNNLLQTRDDAIGGFRKKNANQHDTRYVHMTNDASSPDHFKVDFSVKGYMTIRDESHAIYNYKLHETYSYDVMICYHSEMILRTCYEIGAKVFIHTWGDISYARMMVHHANLCGWK
jgi:hypothetical protein